MRHINTHRLNVSANELNITAVDIPGSGGACHHYCISGYNPNSNVSYVGPEIKDNEPGPITNILFQNGPIKEVGVNGLTHEVLLAIIIDRLQSFQEGPFKSRENAIALTHLETALLWLHKRTLDRQARGVEGMHKV